MKKQEETKRIREDLDHLHKRVIKTLISILDNDNMDEIDKGKLGACSTAVTLLKQNKIVVDPELIDAGDPDKFLLESIDDLPDFNPKT